MLWLAYPLFAFLVTMYSVAIFGEFIKEDGMITQEYIFVCIGMGLIIIFRRVLRML